MAVEILSLIKRNIDAIPIPKSGERPVYKDPNTHGLELRVAQNGQKTFYWRGRVKGGETIRATIGRYPSVTPEAAKKQALLYSAEAVKGVDPAETARKRLQEQTFEDLFKEYMRRHAKGKKSGEAIEKHYQRHLAKPLGSKKISKIDKRTLADINSKIGATRPTTANRLMEIISSVFNRAIEWGLCDTNPAKDIKAFPEKSRKRFIEPNEIPYLFESLHAEPSADMRDFFLLSLLTGARRNNVMAMRWAEIDMAAREWHIPDTKNGDPVTIQLAPEAVAILEARKTAALSIVYVLPSTGKTGHIVEPKAAWRRVYRRGESFRLIDLIATARQWNADTIEREKIGADLAGKMEALTERALSLGLDIGRPVLQGARIHDLRRSLGSWQARTGASLVIIGKSLGHKSLQATAIYAQLDTDPVRQSVERATAAMYAAAGLTDTAELVSLPRTSPKGVK